MKNLAEKRKVACGCGWIKDLWDTGLLLVWAVGLRHSSTRFGLVKVQRSHAQGCFQFSELKPVKGLGRTSEKVDMSRYSI